MGFLLFQLNRLRETKIEREFQLRFEFLYSLVKPVIKKILRKKTLKLDLYNK